MTELTYTLLGDGPSDEALLRHVKWLMREHVRDDLALRQQWADLTRVRPAPKGLSARIRAACRSYPCDILFVHRDAETAARQTRRQEIEGAVQSFATEIPPIVCVIPVRMQEAWMLFDESSIRSAAGNPNGKSTLQLPRLRDIEAIPDPKDLLYQLLKEASEYRGRRLRKFRVQQCARRVAELIDDFSPLRSLPAFTAFEAELIEVLHQNNWK